MKKIFFTGSDGFLGSHLIRDLKSAYPDFYIHEFSGQIENYDSIESEFKLHHWDIVIHFAGLSHVVDCEKNPQSAFEVNTLGTIFLCHLMEKYKFSGKVYFTSTAQVYEAPSEEKEVIYNFSSPVKPQNTYAKTKYYSEGILKSFAETSKCEVNILRLFNHTHKSQSRKFLLPSVFNQISEAKDGDSIKVGNLYLERDFSLIGDFVSFLKVHILSGFNSGFHMINLSSGVARKLVDLVDKLIQRSGKKLVIVVDQSLIRHIDPKKIIGDFETSYKSKLSDDEFIDSFLQD